MSIATDMVVIVEALSHKEVISQSFYLTDKFHRCMTSVYVAKHCGKISFAS